MQVPKFMARKGMVAGVGALAVVAAGGTAYAATGASGGSTDQSAVVAAAGGRGHARALLRRADHATIELKVKGQWVTYTIDRGTVSAVSPTSITLSRPDGQSVTEALTPQTHYRGVTSESAIQTGRPALVVSEGGTALRVRQASTGDVTAPAA